MSDYNFKTAQQHELDWQKLYIETVLPSVYDDWKRKGGAKSSESVLRGWFPRSFKHVDLFYRDIKGKKLVEIGCGSIPHLRESWGEDRTVIDPLATKYMEHQESLWGGSFFDGMTIISNQAEIVVDDLVGNVDGLIICRNTLDHAEDPLSILYNISLYARSGCYFLFWSDLWHGVEPDPGHKNITKSIYAIEALVNGLGFNNLSYIDKQRGSDGFVEHGGIYIKT